MKSPQSSAAELFSVWVTFDPRVEYAVRVSVAVKKSGVGQHDFHSVGSEAVNAVGECDVYILCATLLPFV